MAQIINPFLRGQYAAAEGLATLLKLKAMQEEQPLKMDLMRAQIADAQAKPADRIAQREATQATNMLRLQQQASQFDQTMQTRLRTITNAEERAAWEREYQQGRLALEAAARQQGAERLFYDTGIRTPVPSVGSAPAATVAPPTATTPAPAPSGGLERLLNPQQVSASVNAMFPPAAQAAAAAEGAEIQRRELMPNGGGMLPNTLTRSPLTAGADPAMAAAFPLTSGGSAPLPAQAVPPAAPADPTVAPLQQMPQFTGSPRQIAEARNKWLAERRESYGAPFEVTGANGRPQLVMQHKQTGQIVDANTREAITGGVGPKIGETAQKQQTGVQTTKDAIVEYRDALKSFTVADLVNPAARARMGTVYNNMLLQAKEAYNLGVLNGPDYMILQQVITNPASFTGAITTKKALDDQAAKLDQIMSRIGTRVTQTQAGVTANPGRRSTDNPAPTNAKGWRLMTDARGNKAYVGPNNEIEEVR